MDGMRRLEDLETELARDRARMREIEKRKQQLLEHIPCEGFRAAAEGTKLRAEEEMLEDRVLRISCLLVDAKRQRR